jgi:hypothetical protein
MQKILVHHTRYYRWQKRWKSGLRLITGSGKYLKTRVLKWKLGVPECNAFCVIAAVVIACL